MEQLKPRLFKPVNRVHRTGQRPDPDSVMELDQELPNRHSTLYQVWKQIVLSALDVYFKQVNCFRPQIPGNGRKTAYRYLHLG